MNEEFGEEDRHLRERAVEANFAFWNALLTVNGVITAIFSSAAVLQVGPAKGVFIVVVLVSIFASALLIANFRAVQSFYDVLGQLSEQQIAAMSADGRRQQIQDGNRSRNRIRRRETVVMVCLIVEALLIVGAVAAAGCCGR